jgi:hypothetical protein
MFKVRDWLQDNSIERKADQHLSRAKGHLHSINQRQNDWLWTESLGNKKVAGSQRRVSQRSERWKPKETKLNEWDQTLALSWGSLSEKAQVIALEEIIFICRTIPNTRAKVHFIS